MTGKQALQELEWVLFYVPDSMRSMHLARTYQALRTVSQTFPTKRAKWKRMFETIQLAQIELCKQQQKIQKQSKPEPKEKARNAKKNHV